MQQQKLSNGFCIGRNLCKRLIVIGLAGVFLKYQNGGKILETLLPRNSFVSLEKSTKNSFQHTVPPRVWLGSMIPSAFLHQRYEVLVIIRVDG